VLHLCFVCSILKDVSSTSLSQAHVGNYYPLQPALLPEAFTAFHQAFYAPRGPGKAPGGGGGGARSGGCKGLQDEMSVTSGAASSGAAGGAQQAPVVMYRQCIHELTSAALSLGGRPGRLLLKGPAGAGKSCALAALVERARADKWWVVPGVEAVRCQQSLRCSRRLSLYLSTTCQAEVVHMACAPIDLLLCAPQAGGVPPLSHSPGAWRLL
jgi:hypothetical protein